MSKTPFLPLFFGDFLASTAEWLGEERSMYLTLLGQQWSLGSLPGEPERVRRIVQWEPKLFARCWPTVSAKFEERDGRLYNGRLEQHRDKADALAEKNRASGRKGAAARWQGDGERHSERHQSANDADIANAMASPKPRHESANGVTHSIPSHPIPKKRERGRAQRVPRAPTEFQPDLDYARSQIPDIDAEAEARKFRDWEFNPPRSDWPATWRNWIARAKENGRYAKIAGVIQWQ